jgi:hypothetical protein
MFPVSVFETGVCGGHLRFNSSIGLQIMNEQDKAIYDEILRLYYENGYDEEGEHHEKRMRFQTILYRVREELIRKTNEQYP